ncbi:MAG: hypothetical protein HC933_00930 [Pleurocapsa sp. SU_196_0]|nr:hypothetical protein [Pleurocapsa sp. SU_196_0]
MISDITGRVKLTGQGAETTIVDAGKGDRLFDVRPNARFWLSNVTLQSGKPVDFAEDGGAIRMLGDPRQSSLEISNAVLEGSESGGNGGAVFGTASIRDSVIRRNTAKYYGGGLYGTVTVEGSLITQNTASGGGGVLGIRASIRRSIIADNTARGGGGVTLNGGVLYGVLVRGNTASDDRGGGVFLSGEPARVEGSVIDANRARIGGGVYQDAYTTLELVNSMISSNTATERAGGMLSLWNTTVAFSSFVRNSAPSGGGLALQNQNRPDRVDAFHGVLFAENIAPQGPECLGKLTSSGYNLVQNPADCLFNAAYRNKAGVVTDKVGENPGLQSVSDRFFGTLLVPGRSSGAANWVPKADCAMPNGAPLEVDLTGGSRVRGTGCEIGAVEATP